MSTLQEGARTREKCRAFRTGACPGFFPRDTRGVKVLALLTALAFHAQVTPVPARYHLTSWHPGCPVARSDLRLVAVTHWGVDRRVHTGPPVVSAPAAPAVLRALPGPFAARLPTRRMQLVERYGADDRRSMAADNTSAFNCRRVEGSTSWSAHAYGLAIDINPLENPFVRDGHVLPPAGREFLDRSRRRPGMIHRGDAVVRAFAAVGCPSAGPRPDPP